MKEDAGSQDREAKEGGEEGDQDSYEVTGVGQGRSPGVLPWERKGMDLLGEGRSQARRARGDLL